MSSEGYLCPCTQFCGIPPQACLFCRFMAILTLYVRHVRRLAEDHDVPMPALDVALQHMLSARAHGGADLDWTALVGGQRITAGMPPFSGKVSGHKSPLRQRVDTDGGL